MTMPTMPPMPPSAAAAAQEPLNPTAFEQAARIVQFLQQRLRTVVIGQSQVIDEVLTAFLAGGHVLIEGVPGVGKTLLVRALAQTFSGSFNRIQFTPDLMPGDVTGHYWYNTREQRFELRQGPVFTHLLLADEINRAPAKTQSALLEVMQEYAVTLDGQSHAVPKPFMVLATQNPVEQEGTYPLPEAQLDRFMFKILIDYPDFADEVRMVQDVSSAKDNDILQQNPLTKALSPQHIATAQAIVNRVTADTHIIDYAVRLVAATRSWHGLSIGAGPRASLALINGARAWALVNGQSFVTPDHIKRIWLPTLRHRVRLSTEMEMEGTRTDQVLNEIAASVAAPRA